MDRAVFDRMQAQEETHWWFSGRRRVIAALIGRTVNLPDDAKVLEAGCGTGGNLAFLSRFGALDAFEYDSAARAAAELRLGRPVPAGALPDTIPGRRKYDLIALLDVLEHVEQDTESLRALGARLKVDGCLVVTVPAFGWMWSRHDEVHHHYRRYTRAQLTAVAEAAGLTVVASGYFNFLLFIPALLLRFAKKIAGRDTPDDSLPPAPLNALFKAVFSVERHLIGRVPMPFGLSVFAVLTR